MIPESLSGWTLEVLRASAGRLKGSVSNYHLATPCRHAEGLGKGHG
jgi:hypothetical protein